jgi:hypothetical protein
MVGNQEIFERYFLPALLHSIQYFGESESDASAGQDNRLVRWLRTWDSEQQTIVSTAISQNAHGTMK